MPARKPQTPRPRDQLVEFDAGSDSGKQRMIGELARVAGDVGARLAKIESRPNVTGSRGGNAALASLLTALDGLGLIKDETTT